MHEKPLILIKSRPKNNDMSKILIYFPLQGQFGSHFRFPCLNALEGNFLSCAIDFISGGDLKQEFERFSPIAIYILHCKCVQINKLTTYLSTNKKSNTTPISNFYTLLLVISSSVTCNVNIVEID